MNFSDLPRGRPGTAADSGYAPRALWMPQRTIAESDFWSWVPDAVFLGATEDRQLVGVRDNRHLLTVAGSRAGKGQAAILPNLAHYTGSVMVIDPRGENATLTAERRGQGRGIPDGGLGQDVYVLDPFDVAEVPDEYRAGYNPLADLDPASPFIVDNCDSIADALVVASPGHETDHWNGSARLVLRGFIAWVAASPTIELPRTLGTLRKLLHLPPVATEKTLGFDALLEEMIDHPQVADGVPSEAAAALAGMGEDEAGSVLSTVRQNIVFLSSPGMAKLLEGGERVPDLTAWKMGRVSVPSANPDAPARPVFPALRQSAPGGCRVPQGVAEGAGADDPGRDARPGTHGGARDRRRVDCRLWRADLVDLAGLRPAQEPLSRPVGDVPRQRVGVSVVRAQRPDDAQVRVGSARHVVDAFDLEERAVDGRGRTGVLGGEPIDPGVAVAVAGGGCGPLFAAVWQPACALPGCVAHFSEARPVPRSMVRSGSRIRHPCSVSETADAW